MAESNGNKAEPRFDTDQYIKLENWSRVLQRISRVDEMLCHDGVHQCYREVLGEIRQLHHAQYGAIGLFDEQGKLTDFIVDGVSEAEAATIGCLPAGEGLLRAFYRESAALRVADIAGDPCSCGFPSGHPPMKNLLGTPLVVGGRVRGVVYLTNKHGLGDTEPSAFTEFDEILLTRIGDYFAHTIERVELVQALRVTNQKLRQEKEEQQKLIEELHKAQNQLLQSEKMASIGQLAAGVAHEINNPIGYVYSNLGTLEKYVLNIFSMLDVYEQAEDAIADSGVHTQVQAAKKSLDTEFMKDDLRALMDESKEGIIRVKKIVQDLKDFSHLDESEEWIFANLHHGMDSTLNIVNNELKYKAEVAREYGDIPLVECLPSQLNQVFMNLLVNAAHAIENRGTITVRTGKEKDGVWVEIADTGKGIAPEHMPRIFDPFFTTKPIGKGTGLGLSLSYSIVQKHRGRIEVQSELGKGTSFKVWLPLSKTQGETVNR